MSWRCYICVRWGSGAAPPCCMWAWGRRCAPGHSPPHPLCGTQPLRRRRGIRGGGGLPGLRHQWDGGGAVRGLRLWLRPNWRQRSPQAYRGLRTLQQQQRRAAQSAGALCGRGPCTHAPCGSAVRGNGPGPSWPPHPLAAAAAAAAAAASHAKCRCIPENVSCPAGGGCMCIRYSDEAAICGPR